MILILKQSAELTSAELSSTHRGANIKAKTNPFNVYRILVVESHVHVPTGFTARGRRDPFSSPRHPVHESGMLTGWNSRAASRAKLHVQ